MIHNAVVYTCSLRFWLNAVAIFACLGVANGDTYTPKIVLGPWAGALKVGPGMIATGHRIWGTEIVGHDLTNACFDDCNLAGVAFRQCILKGATFRRALMTGLVVDDCQWADNDFSGAVQNGIMYPYINDRWEVMGMSVEQFKSTWSYKNRDLSDCVVPANTSGMMYDFTDFKLLRTYFFKVSNCRFTHSRLENATFQYCDLTNCVFDDAVVSNIRIQDSRMDMSVMDTATSFPLSGCAFADVEFIGQIDLSNKNLTGAGLNCKNNCVPNFENTIIKGFSTSRVLNTANIVKTQSFKEGNLLQISISKTDLTNTDFSGQLLALARFSRCDFTNCKFDDAVITGTVFNECTGITREQIESTWNFKQGRMAEVNLPAGLPVFKPHIR